MSQKEQVLTLYRQYGEQYDKYSYFLLAATGAALAYVLQSLQGKAFVWATAPFVFAAVCWVVSLYLGTRRIDSVLKTIRFNMEILLVTEGTHHRQPRPDDTPGVLRTLHQSMEKQNSASARYTRWQFRLLVIGVASFTAGRFYEMWLGS